MEAVQEEGEVGGGFRGQAVVFEAHVVAHRIRGVPAVAKRRIGHDGVEARLLGRVQLAQRVPFVEERVAVKDVELRILHPLQQHVHAGQVVGGDVLFLPVDFANGAVRVFHPVPHIQEQGAGPAGEIEHALQPLLRPGLWFLTVQRDDSGEDVGNLLRGVELARLLAGPGAKLTEKQAGEIVAVGRARSIGFRIALCPLTTWPTTPEDDPSWILPNNFKILVASDEFREIRKS